MAITAQFAAGADLTAAMLKASSIPVVSSTADITSPFTGQMVFNTTDNQLYRYTGSAWAVYTNHINREAVQTADQALGAVADLAGASLTFTVATSSASVKVLGIFDNTVTGTVTVIGTCMVDGVSQTAEAHGGGVANLRLTVAQTWQLTLAAGSHTVKLRGTISTGAGTMFGTHTKISIAQDGL
jgi:hypothetical protein